MPSNIQTTIRNNRCNAWVDALDVGTTDPSGDLTVHTASYAVLLATLIFSAPAFGSSSGGVATASTITAGTAVATGTAAAARCRDRDNATCWDMTCGTSGEYTLNSAAITNGSTVSCSSFTVTEPASG